MKDKVITFIKEHKLLLFFLAAALIKQLLLMGVPICVVSGSPCDDELMKKWALSIAQFDWLGDFDSYTFMKEPGFALFLAICFRLHLPFIFSVTLGYSLACMIFSSSLTHVFSSKKYVAAIYLILLFHPISYSSSVLQRVYRNGLGMVLTLCVFGGLLHMYFSVCDEKLRVLVFWSAFTGLSLGYLWITKSDALWLLPFIVVICLVMLGILLAKHRRLKSLPRYLCLLLPFLGIFLCSNGIKFLNIQWYGASGIEYYGAAMDDITHIKSGQGNEKIHVTRKQLKELYKISPTLAGVQDMVESSMDAYNICDTNPKDGEVEDGWLGWALVNAFSNAGVYKDCETANNFYKNVYDELEAAFLAGKLERAKVSTARKYYIDTPAHTAKLAAHAWGAVEYMTSYKETYALSVGKKKGSESQFEFITRNWAAAQSQKDDYLIRGWIVFPMYDGKQIDVYVEDEEGNRYKELSFEESEDVFGYLEEKNTFLSSAKKCRFEEGWNVEGHKLDTSWYLGVYQNGQKEGRVRLTEDEFVGDKKLEYIGSLDLLTCKVDEDAKAKIGNEAVNRLNLIGAPYRVSGKAVFWLGVISYIALTVVVILDLKRKRFEHGNAWLIATGLGLSVLVFVVGIASVDLTQCPAINSMYLSSGYLILLGAGLVSTCKCIEMAVDVILAICERKECCLRRKEI